MDTIESLMREINSLKRESRGLVFRIFWLIVLLVASLYFLFTSVRTNAMAEVTMYESKLGQRVVLGGDTLLIIDYSILTETYMLSNGVRISAELINKQK